MGSELYASLLSSAADDYEAGGITAVLLEGEEDSPWGSVPALRLVGSLHRLVLERLAPSLAIYFPSVGGTYSDDGLWDAALRTMNEHFDLMSAYVKLPVQTNEVGRSVLLLTGVLAAVRSTGVSRVRLLEVGASAGLNLRFDQYRYVAGDASLGPVDAPVVFLDPWVGPAPDLSGDFEIVERRGCDPTPIDSHSEEGRLALTSFVWADQVHRFERLRGALAIAHELPVAVDEAGGADWLASQLAIDTDALTIVWHSIVMQYIAPTERERIDEVIANATLSGPLVRLAYEPTRDFQGDYPYQLTASSRGGATPLALGGGHGPPVRLL